MRLRNHTKYILSIVSIGCIGLMLINFAFKNNRHKTIDNKTSRIIIETPKKSNVRDSKEVTSDGRTRVTVPYGNPTSPNQPLPIPDPKAPIIITLL